MERAWQQSNYEENLYNKRRRNDGGMNTRMERPHSIAMAFFGDGLLKEKKNVVENGMSTVLNSKMYNLCK